MTVQTNYVEVDDTECEKENEDSDIVQTDDAKVDDNVYENENINNLTIRGKKI